MLNKLLLLPFRDWWLHQYSCSWLFLVWLYLHWNWFSLPGLSLFTSWCFFPPNSLMFLECRGGLSGSYISTYLLPVWELSGRLTNQSSREFDVIAQWLWCIFLIFLVISVLKSYKVYTLCNYLRLITAINHICIIFYAAGIIYTLGARLLFLKQDLPGFGPVKFYWPLAEIGLGTGVNSKTGRGPWVVQEDALERSRPWHQVNKGKKKKDCSRLSVHFTSLAYSKC